MSRRGSYTGNPEYRGNPKSRWARAQKRSVTGYPEKHKMNTEKTLRLKKKTTETTNR